MGLSLLLDEQADPGGGLVDLDGIERGPSTVVDLDRRLGMFES